MPSRIIKDGWLTKRGGGTTTLGRTNWKRRWFVLRGDVLRYFATEVDPATSDEDALGVINLSECRKVEPDTTTKKNWALALSLPDRIFFVHADSERDQYSWLQVLTGVITKAVVPLEFQELIAKGKNVLQARLQEVPQEAVENDPADAPSVDSGYANADELLLKGESSGGSSYERVSNVLYETLATNCPLLGLKSTPLVGFDVALAEAAAATGTDLSATMEKSFRFAVELVQVRKQSRGLKVDEVAAINIYTHHRPKAFYAGLNASMGGYAQDKHDSLPGYLPFIRLLLSAMFKLQHVAALVWRGVKGTPAALLGGADKGPGDEVTWWTFTSTTLSADVTKAFIEADGPRVMFRIQVAAGVQIGSFSDFRGVEEGMESEQEVIVLPGTRFAIDAVHELGGGLTEVRMHEVVGGYSRIEAALSERRPAAATVGRCQLKPVPGGDSAMAWAYSEAGVDGTYAEVAVYEEVDGTYAEVAVYEEVDGTYAEVAVYDVLHPAGSKPDAVHGEGAAAAAAAACSAAGIALETDASGVTALMRAAKSGKVEAATALIASGAKFDAAHKDGWTPLYVASQNGQAEVAALLLKNGAKVDAAAKDDSTPLHTASYNGHAEVAALLLDNGAKVDAANYKGCTTLHFASNNGRTEVAALLLKNGAKVDAADNNEASSLHVASQNGHAEVAALLLKNGAKVDAATNNEATPLHAASQNGHAEVAALLLKNGAKVDAATNNEATPLYVASQNGHAEVAALLLKNGAKVDAATHNDATPLNVASQIGHAEVAALLLDNGAKVDAANDNEATPLHVASENGHAEVAALLLKNGAKVDAANNNKATPLYVASQNGHAEVAALLLENGAKVDAANYKGWTPIFLASTKGNTDVVKLLLAHCADTTKTFRKEGADWTPLARVVPSQVTADLEFLPDSRGMRT